MLQTIVSALDDLPYDAMITYAHGILFFVFASALPESHRKAIIATIGTPIGDCSTSGTSVTIVPTGQTAHLIGSTESVEILGRDDRWLVLGPKTWTTASERFKSAGTHPTDVKSLSSSPNVPMQRRSSLALRAS